MGKRYAADSERRKERGAGSGENKEGAGGLRGFVGRKMRLLRKIWDGDGNFGTGGQNIQQNTIRERKTSGTKKKNMRDGVGLWEGRDKRKLGSCQEIWEVYGDGGTWGQNIQHIRTGRKKERKAAKWRLTVKKERGNVLLERTEMQNDSGEGMG